MCYHRGAILDRLPPVGKMSYLCVNLFSYFSAFTLILHFLRRINALYMGWEGQKNRVICI